MLISEASARDWMKCKIVDCYLGRARLRIIPRTWSLILHNFLARWVVEAINTRMKPRWIMEISDLARLRLRIILQSLFHVDYSDCPPIPDWGSDRIKLLAKFPPGDVDTDRWIVSMFQVVFGQNKSWNWGAINGTSRWRAVTISENNFSYEKSEGWSIHCSCCTRWLANHRLGGELAFHVPCAQFLLLTLSKSTGQLAS
jgi:hypothetical protein